MSHKKTVCVDLDGVLAHYDGWQGEDHIGEPQPGAAAFTRLLSQFARVVVFTTRCKVDPFGSARPGSEDVEVLVRRVRAWLDRHRFAYDEVYAGQGKPIAAAYLDDRAVAIRANPDSQDFAPALEEIRRLLE